MAFLLDSWSDSLNYCNNGCMVYEAFMSQSFACTTWNMTRPQQNPPTRTPVPTVYLFPKTNIVIVSCKFIWVILSPFDHMRPKIPCESHNKAMWEIDSLFSTKSQSWFLKQSCLLLNIYKHRILTCSFSVKSVWIWASSLSGKPSGKHSAKIYFYTQIPRDHLMVWVVL